MSVPTYTPSKNNDQAGVEKVFALPEEVQFIKSYLSGNPTLSGDEAKSIRSITTEIREDVSSAETAINLLDGEVYGKPAEAGDASKSIRTLIAEIKGAIVSLDARVTALENKN